MTQYDVANTESSPHTSQRSQSSDDVTSLVSKMLGITHAKSKKALQQLVGDGVLDFQALKLLLNAKSEQLMTAFTPAQVAKLNAAIELMRRMNCSNAEAAIIDNSRLAAQALFYYVSNRDTERFAVLVLNYKHQLLATQVIAIGSQTECSADPSQIFGSIIKAGGKRAIVAHNHPSGKVEPSPEDMNITEILIQGGKVLNLPILDHLIIGNGNRYRSLRETTNLWDV